MHTQNLTAYVLAVVLALALPLAGPFERRIYRSNPATPVKLLTYATLVGLLWVLSAASVRIEGVERLLENPAAGTAWLWAPAILGPGLGLAGGAVLVIALMPLIQSLRGPRRRQAYAAAYRRGFADLPGFLPNTPSERMAWVALSLSAGICEEVLFRGFLIRFLHDAGFGLPLAAALGVSSLIFGLCHLYQGYKGVVGSAVAGLSLGLLFLLSGSLVLCMVVHAALDLQVVYILRPASPDPALQTEAA